MRQFLRLSFIVYIVLRYGLDELALSPFRQRPVRVLARLITFGRRLEEPRGVRLRRALERLGPIFVKFGQVLSTRRDLLPPDLSDELAKLQDRVPPFPAAQARELVEKAFGRPVDAVFARFDAEPVASASVAQVHFALLQDGREVAVKVLRPRMLATIEDDLALLHRLARWVERLSADGKRLRPREVVAEFDIYLHDELDLVREAANAAQLRRNMQGLDLVLIPEMVWDLCTPTVMVMQRMSGVPINQTQRLREAGVDFRKLARDGVTIFFTQVFRDGFFHADMHPGNIQVSLDPATFGRYIALDFGIIGTLNEVDKDYLAQNFIAFFRRDYKRVAELHVESGWVPSGTRVDALEGAIRAVCEPHFDRPLKDISLGQVLMRLFQTSCCCRRRCSTSRAWGASSTRNWTCGPRPSPFSSAGWTSRSAGAACCCAWRSRRRTTRTCCRSCRGCCTSGCRSRPRAPMRSGCCSACWRSSGAATGCCRRWCSARWAFSPAWWRRNC